MKSVIDITGSQLLAYSQLDTKAGKATYPPSQLHHSHCEPTLDNLSGKKGALAVFPFCHEKERCRWRTSCSPVFAAQWMRTRVHDSHVTMTRGQCREKHQRAEDSWVNRWKRLGPCWLAWAAQLTQGLFNLWIKDPSSLSHWSSSSLLLPDKINQTGRVWRVCNKKEFKFYSQGVGLGNWAEEGASYWDKITTQTMCARSGGSV